MGALARSGTGSAALNQTRRLQMALQPTESDPAEYNH
jgi:hypothetical protein